MVGGVALNAWMVGAAAVSGGPILALLQAASEATRLMTARVWAAERACIVDLLTRLATRSRGAGE